MADFVSILPPPLATDERFAALERLEADQLARHDLSALVPNLVDTAPRWMLPYLAEQFGVLGSETWRLCSDDDMRRDLIRNGIRLRKYHGTPWSVVEVFRILGLVATLQEWFDYDGERGTFRIDLAVPDRGITEDLYHRAVRAVMEQKNLRSHLDRLRIIAATGGTLFIGGATVMSETLTVGPWSPTDQASAGQLHVGMVSTVAEIIHVYPKS